MKTIIESAMSLFSVTELNQAARAKFKKPWRDLSLKQQKELAKEECTKYCDEIRPYRENCFNSDQVWDQKKKVEKWYLHMKQRPSEKEMDFWHEELSLVHPAKARIVPDAKSKAGNYVRVYIGYEG